MCSYNPLTSLTGAGMLWMEVQLDDAENMGVTSPSVFLQNESSGFLAAAFIMWTCARTHRSCDERDLSKHSLALPQQSYTVKLNEHHCHFNRSNELLHWQTIEVIINSYWRFFVILHFHYSFFDDFSKFVFVVFVVLLDIVHAFVFNYVFIKYNLALVIFVLQVAINKNEKYCYLLFILKIFYFS